MSDKQAGSWIKKPCLFSLGDFLVFFPVVGLVNLNGYVQTLCAFGTDSNVLGQKSMPLNGS
jgi:hypothetical protein